MKYFKNSMDLSSRLFVGSQMEQKRGEYGTVTALGVKYGVSRWFLYESCRNLWRQAIDYLSNCSSFSSSLPLCQSLEERVLSLYLENESSLEGIQRSLHSLCGESLSIGKISEILNHYGAFLPQSALIEGVEEKKI